MSTVEVVVLGDINVDVLLSIPSFPEPGGEAFADRVSVQAGGSASNTAIALAKLGIRVRMIGRVGEDAWADVALRALTEAGVDVSAVQRDMETSTGLLFIPVTPDGERTMLTARGANVRTDPAAITPDVLDGARLLHVSGYALLEAPQRDAALRAIDLAGQQGIAISLDTGLQPALMATQQIRRLLPRLSTCVLGPDEARALVEVDSPSEAVAELIAQGVEVVGLKLGAEGCLVADAERVERVPAFESAAVDTTGAGDAFSAGLIFGRLRGLGLPASATLANALGSLATRAWGAGSSLPGRVAVTRLLREHHTRSEGDHAERIAEALRALAEDSPLT
jgi:ribokinase